MSGNENITIKIMPQLGITHALQSYITNPDQKDKFTISDGKITAKEWDKTLDKLIEINQKRKNDNKTPIFTGNTNKNDYRTSFVVQPNQEIEFTKDEMNELFAAMGVTINSAAGGQDNEQEVENENQQGQENGQSGNETKFSQIVDVSHPDNVGASIAKVCAEASTQEELDAKVEKLNALKQIDPWGDYCEEESARIADTLIEYLDSGDTALQYAAAAKFGCSLTLRDADNIRVNEAVIATKDSGVLDRAFSLEMKDVTPEQAQKIYNLTKDENFIKECKDNDRDYLINDLRHNLFEHAPEDVKKEILQNGSDAFISRLWSEKNISKNSLFELMQEKDLSNGRILSYLKQCRDKLSDSEASAVISRLKPLNADEMKRFSDIKDYSGILNADKFHVVKPGETLDGIISDYVLKNGIINYLSEAIEENPEKWTPERQQEAAQQYMTDFRDRLAEKLKIYSTGSFRFTKDRYSNLKAGQIIDFTKIDEWPQPGIINWKLWY